MNLWAHVLAYFLCLSSILQTGNCKTNSARSHSSLIQSLLYNKPGIKLRGNGIEKGRDDGKGQKGLGNYWSNYS